MERIGVVGLSWRQGGPEALARFTVPAEEREERVPALATAIAAEELVYMATCNRVEVAFVCEKGVTIADYRRRIFDALTGAPAEPGEAERSLRAWAGEGAAEHLFLVATGLDSARVGETEVAGQVRDALELSRRLGLAGNRLGVLFDEALKLARRTSDRTAIGEGRTSLAEIALDAVRARLRREEGLVALIGVSPMTVRCARSLRDESIPLLVVNRDVARAQHLCEELSTTPGADPSSVARFMALDAFRAAPPRVAAVVSATGAPTALLHRAELSAMREACEPSLPPVLVDLAIPPDIEPEAAHDLGFERFGMDEVLSVAEENRERRVLEMGGARELVDQAVLNLERRLAQGSVDGAIKALHERYRTTAADQMERLLRAEFSDLDEARRETLRRFVARLARHYAHLPATGLREAALQFGPEIVKTFFSRADESLSHDLEATLDDGEIFAGLLGTPPEEHRP